MSEHLLAWVVPFRPAWAALRIRKAPHWLLSFCILAAIAGMIEVAAHPRSVMATLAHLPPSATASERRVVQEDLEAALPLRVSILPAQLLLRWSARALIVYMLLLAFGAGTPPRGKHLMSISVGVGVVEICERILETVYHISVFAPDTAAYPWTALALAGGVSRYTSALLLTSLNMFTLWFVGAMGWALSVLCGISRIKAVLIAATAWAVAAGCNIALLHLLRNAYVLFP